MLTWPASSNSRYAHLCLKRIYQRNNLVQHHHQQQQRQLRHYYCCLSLVSVLTTVKNVHVTFHLSSRRNIFRSAYTAFYSTTARSYSQTHIQLPFKMASKPGYIGSIDQGTTSSRFFIFDHAGKVVTSHQVSIRQYHPHAGQVKYN